MLLLLDRSESERNLNQHLQFFLMPLPKLGSKAPSFTLPDQNGKDVSLSDFKGKTVVLYFYPKDDTPGCTIEACAFRDDNSKLRAAGAEILGVSVDNEISHQKFIKKCSLNFPLLSDTKKEVVKKYGIWGDKSFMGRIFKGVRRTTFLISPDGKIAYVWENVKPAGHAKEVLEKIKEFSL